MAHERPRCFVAISIGEELRAALSAALERDLRPADLRWTDPAGWHVTLAFLGSVEAGTVPELIDRIASAAARHAATRSSTGGFGAFPSPGRARVAWYGVDDAEGRLARLATDVAEALDLDASRPFRPHITLGRARRQAVDLRPWLESASAPAGVLETDQIELMRSHTGSGPARYETLATIPLGVPADV